MREPLDNALQECLEQLHQGATVEECLERYPQLAAELAPLLRAATAGMAAARVEPRPEFQAELRYRLLALARERARWRSRPFALIRALARPWAVAMVVLVLLGGAATGATAASANTVPGDPLYVVKGVRERVQLFLTRSDPARARLQAHFAQNRARELAAVAEVADQKTVEHLAHRMAVHAQQAAAISARLEPPLPQRPDVKLPPRLLRTRQELQERLEENLQIQTLLLQRAVRRAPLQAQPLLRQTLREAQQEYCQAILHLGMGMHPGMGMMDMMGAGASGQVPSFMEGLPCPDQEPVPR